MTAGAVPAAASLSAPALDDVVALGPVHWAAAGAEVVVQLPAVAAAHVLDPAAAVLWQCLDGVSPLRAVFGDMAEAYGVAPSVIAADCLPVVASWLQAGIATVGSPPVAAPPPEPVAPPAAASASGRTWRRLVDPPST